VMTAYLAASRQWSLWRALFPPAAVLAFLFVAVPWYAAIYADQGRHFIDDFLLGHNLSRFTTTVHRHPGPPWYYLPVLVGGGCGAGGLRRIRQSSPACVVSSPPTVPSVPSMLPHPIAVSAIAAAMLPNIPTIPTRLMTPFAFSPRFRSPNQVRNAASGDKGWTRL